MATKRRLTKQPAGSVTCDGQVLTVIDEAALGARRIAVACQCGRRHMIDAAPAVQGAIDAATVGALALPSGEYRAIANVGYNGRVLSIQLVRDS